MTHCTDWEPLYSFFLQLDISFAVSNEIEYAWFHHLNDWIIDYNKQSRYQRFPNKYCHLIVFYIGIYQHLFLFQEYEHKILPWLYIFAVFTILRFLGWLFFSIVNDLIFGYNITMCLLWAIFCGLNIYGWILVYSLYLELSDLTKLEDLAHLRVSLFW